MVSIRHRSEPFYPMMFGLLTAVWGLWLLLPGSSYHVNHGFHYISQFVSEPILGSVALAIGIFQAAFVFLKRSGFVGGMAHISFYFWLFLAVSFLISDWHAVSGVIYAWLTFMNGVGYANWKLNQEEDSLVD